MHSDRPHRTRVVGSGRTRRGGPGRGRSWRGQRVEGTRGVERVSISRGCGGARLSDWEESRGGRPASAVDVGFQGWGGRALTEGCERHARPQCGWRSRREWRSWRCVWRETGLRGASTRGRRVQTGRGSIWEASGTGASRERGSRGESSETRARHDTLPGWGHHRQAPTGTRVSPLTPHATPPR